MRINKAYQKMFPNNCPVIETTGDGVEVGTCTYYLHGGVCPRHGNVKKLIAEQEHLPSPAPARAVDEGRKLI